MIEEAETRYLLAIFVRVSPLCTAVVDERNSRRCRRDMYGR